MTWTKLPDDFLGDPRIVGLSDRGFRLYVSGLVYSNAHLTDGFIPRAMATILAPGVRPRNLRELQEQQLWKPVTGGFLVIDFADNQLTKAQVL